MWKTLISGQPGNDFLVYWRAIIYFVSGINPYGGKGSMVFLYPPSFLTTFFFLNWLGLSWATILWRTASLLALVVSIWWLFEKENVGVKIVMVVLALIWFPVRFSLGMGQVNLLVLLGYVLIWRFYAKRSDGAVGIIWGILMGIKITPAILFFFFLTKRRWKIISSGLAVLLVLNLVAIGQAGNEIWQSFMKETAMGFLSPSTYYYNQSLPAFITRLLGNWAWNYCRWLGVAILLLSVEIGKRKNDLLFFCLLITCTTLISPVSWQHHLVFYLPGLFAVWLEWHKKGDLKGLLWLGAIFIVLGWNWKQPGLFATNSILYSHAALAGIALWLTQLTC